MGKFKSMNTGGFTPIAEGTYIFKITKVEDKTDEKYELDKDFGKVCITLQTKDGKTHVERIGIMKENKLEKTWEINTKVFVYFEFFSKTALNNFSLDSWDPEDLVGSYIEATVVHSDSEGTGANAGKTYTNVNLRDLNPSSGFGGSKIVKSEDSDDLDDLDDFLDD